jgi:hypothetical protein
MPSFERFSERGPDSERSRIADIAKITSIEKKKNV